MCSAAHKPLRQGAGLTPSISPLPGTTVLPRPMSCCSPSLCGCVGSLGRKGKSGKSATPSWVHQWRLGCTPGGTGEKILSTGLAGRGLRISLCCLFSQAGAGEGGGLRREETAGESRELVDQGILCDVQQHGGREAPRWDGQASPSWLWLSGPVLWLTPRWGDQVLAFDHKGNMIPWVHPTEIPLHNPSLKGAPLGPWCWANPSKASLVGLRRAWHPLGLCPAGLSISRA